MAENKPPCPPGCVCHMSRAQAERHFKARSKMLAHRVKSLPPAEQIRFAADCLDRDMKANAIATLRYVLTNLEKQDV